VTLPDLFAHGEWIEQALIPILNEGGKGGTSWSAVADWMRTLLLAGVVNYAWRQQNYFIISYPMAEFMCKLKSSPELHASALLRIATLQMTYH
jgi:hypothetical protein